MAIRSIIAMKAKPARRDEVRTLEQMQMSPVDAPGWSQSVDAGVREQLGIGDS